MGGAETQNTKVFLASIKKRLLSAQARVADSQHRLLSRPASTAIQLLPSRAPPAVTKSFTLLARFFFFTYTLDIRLSKLRMCKRNALFFSQPRQPKKLEVAFAPAPKMRGGGRTPSKQVFPLSGRSSYPPAATIVTSAGKTHRRTASITLV